MSLFPNHCLIFIIGIVTRCPLELKMKRRKEAQDEMAGVGVGISDDLISLEIASPDVPDLTLIDLPGIARVAVKGQPENIGDQVSLFSILTKPDLVDKGTEETVVEIVHNEVIQLKKGYMIVKCRGQKEITEKVNIVCCRMCLDLIFLLFFPQDSVQRRKIESEVEEYEERYRGRELPGFINYKTFEVMVKEQIRLLEEPAIRKLKDVGGE
ncbi:hypothetical protein GOODEAATRI_028767 [Goodea atripinnis]|uniref:Interferon-induced GTP-binding protein Mx n=1 Tax=Goodea atripinnis TaxID=208336 RepID=A0ABV0PHV1_9TELE